MSVGVFLLGIGVFLTCLLGHIMVWRYVEIRRHALILFGLFFIDGFILLAIVTFFSNNLSWYEFCAAGLLHAALSAGYIQIYPACQAQSPSVTLLGAIKRSMPSGMTEEEIWSMLDPEQVFHDRIEELLDAKLIQKRDGKLTLTDQGRMFIVPFIVYRNILGVREGEG